MPTKPLFPKVVCKLGITQSLADTEESLSNVIHGEELVPSSPKARRDRQEPRTVPNTDIDSLSLLVSLDAESPSHPTPRAPDSPDATQSMADELLRLDLKTPSPLHHSIIQPQYAYPQQGMVAYYVPYYPVMYSAPTGYAPPLILFSLSLSILFPQPWKGRRRPASRLWGDQEHSLRFYE